MSGWRVREAVLLAAVSNLCLNAPQARAEPLFAQVILNGVDTGEVLRFERIGERFMAPPPTLRKLGFRAELLTAPEAAPQALSTLPGVTYTFDAGRQILEMSADPRSFVTRRINQSSDLPPSEPSVRGAALNYGLYAFAGAEGGTQATATGEARVFGPEGGLSSSFIYRLAGDGPDGGFRRLDTRFVRYDNARARRLIVGDFVTAGVMARDSVRAVGVSLATDFTLRPDVPVTINPQIRGLAATRSSVEVLVDGVRRFGDVTPAGPFEIDIAAPSNGLGRVSLVVTDAEGRSAVRTFNFYAASELLRPGTAALALEAGALREDYATDQDRYTDGFAAIAARRGLTDAITVEAHATASSSGQVAGVGLVAKLGDAAVLSAAATGSDQSGRGGGQVFLAAKRETRRYAVQISHRRTSADFADLVAHDPRFRLRAETLAGASLHTDGWGALSLAYSDLRSAERQFRVANLVWSGAVGPINLFATGSASVAGRSSYGLTLGLSAPLGRPGRWISSQASSDGRAVRAGVQMAQSADGPGTWGWRAGVDAASGGAGGERLEGEVRRVASAGEVGLGLSHQNGATYAQAYGSGGLAWVGGRLYAANQLGESFAVVETGAPHIEVSVENRVVGRTGRDGRLLALRLSPDAANRLAIRPESVALADDILIQASAVRPPRGGAVVVKMPVRQGRSALARLVDPAGAPLPAGLRVSVNGAPSGVTGFDGLAYLSGLTPGATYLTVESSSGRCRMEIPNVLPTPTAAPLGPFVCHLADPGMLPGPQRFAERGVGGAELYSSDPGGLVRNLPAQRGPAD